MVFGLPQHWNWEVKKKKKPTELDDTSSHAGSQLWSHVSSDIIYFSGIFGFVIIIVADFQAKQGYAKQNTAVCNLTTTHQVLSMYCRHLRLCKVAQKFAY